VTAACLVPVLFLREDGGHGRVFEGVRAYVRHSWHVLRSNPDVGRFLLANAAWEGTFAGARTFVVLYMTVGLGEPLSTSTLVLAAVAGGYVLAALVAGPVGDRFGLARVITWCSVVYGSALLCGGLATTWHAWYLAVIFIVAIFGGSVMTLAWGLLFKLMPEGDRGAISGLATTTKGLGLIFGTLLAGILIDIARPYLPGTDGYQLLWPILGVPILLAVPLVFSLIKAEEASSVVAADS
jgi:MFS family permease